MEILRLNRDFLKELEENKWAVCKVMHLSCLTYLSVVF